MAIKRILEGTIIMKKWQRLNQICEQALGEEILTDEQIADQYKNFKCTSIEIEPSTVHEDWFNATLELEFPNADNPDFDEYVIENLYYNRADNKWGFDNWYPSEITEEIKKLVLAEIEKISPSEPFERIVRLGKNNDAVLVKNKADGKYSIYMMNGDKLATTPIENKTYDTEEKAFARAKELEI